jgi:ABC-2 type transport system permease protein
MLAIWVLVAWGVAAARSGGTYEALYPTPEALQARYDQVMVEVPMFLLFQGPAYGAGVDALLVQESFGAATLFAALGAVIFVVRHTRTDEQAGRRELVGSAPVGRHAPLAAALAVVGAGGALLAVLTGATMTASAMPVTGSLVFGLVVGSAVWVSAAMAAVAAQLTTSPRGAAVGAFALFTALHFVRGVSDLGGPGLAWLGWLTPNGWLQRTQPFAADLWWPFLLVAVPAGGRPGRGPGAAVVHAVGPPRPRRRAVGAASGPYHRLARVGRPVRAGLAAAPHDGAGVGRGHGRRLPAHRPGGVGRHGAVRGR